MRAFRSFGFSSLDLEPRKEGFRQAIWGSFWMLPRASISLYEANSCSHVRYLTVLEG